MNRLAVLLFAILLSITLLTPTAFAKDSNATRPGWGLGDTNHIHTGPAGQSVMPHQDNEANININVSTTTDSGHNNIHHNVGPVTIVTGAVTNVLSFVIKTGSNIFHI